VAERTVEGLLRLQSILLAVKKAWRKRLGPISVPGVATVILFYAPT
jgi:hypothetical protein